MKYILLSIISLSFLSCTHPKKAEKAPELEFHEFPVKKYSKLIEGGFSGLWYLGEQGDELLFWTHTDRGPNAESTKDQRPFLQPAFNPHLIKFSLNRKTGVIRYLEELPLRLPDNELMKGLPNLPPRPKRTGDETPVTTHGLPLKRDLLGIDPEGICLENETIWMVEEYGPSLLKFSKEGKLQARFVAKGYYAPSELSEIEKKFGDNLIKQVLPKDILSRKLNRGFEGVACAPGKIYAVLQSPLHSQVKEVSIFEFDTKTLRVTNTFTYPMEREDADKIGDMAFFKGKLYLIEQNSKTGPDGFHRIFEITPSKKGLNKKLVIDLTLAGFDFTDKLEGLAFDQSGRMFIVNDNDFGLTGSIHEKTKEAEVDSNRKSVIGIVQ